jgi:hypothetical protein
VTTVTRTELAEQAKVQALKPTEKDFAHVFGERRIKRRFRKDGGYSWSLPFTPNQRGKVTKDAHTVGEMMAPYHEAEQVRHGVGRPGDYGRSPHRARTELEHGPDGMLFRRFHGEADWQALGVRCLGTPIGGTADIPLSGTQRDPEGNVWIPKEGRWQRCAST